MTHEEYIAAGYRLLVAGELTRASDVCICGDSVPPNVPWEPLVDPRNNNRTRHIMYRKVESPAQLLAFLATGIKP